MKGKHGQAAAVRHEVQAATAEIQTYRNRVAKLTEETKQLREQLRAEEQRHRRVERELLARLDLIASPKVDALEEVVIARTSERDAARQAAHVWRLRLGNLSRALVTAQVKEGATFEDAMRDVGKLVGMEISGVLETKAKAENRSDEDIELSRTADRALESRARQSGFAPRSPK